MRDRTQSHGTLIRRSTRRQLTASLKRNHGIPGTTTEGGVRETIATTSLAAKTGIIAKSANTRVEETRGAEEKKFHTVTSMAKTKAIGQMNAPSL